MLSLYVNATNLVRWDKMKNRATGAYVNDATVTATLRDADLEIVSGASSVSMPYVALSNGRYQGNLPSTLVLAEGANYFLDVRATSGTTVGFCRIACVACYRGQA
jgi:uncharacterized NAD-dependent epimerase/dehydratase family protein